MLPMQDAMCDHADVMPIEKGDCAHRASPALDLPTGKRRSDQVSQGLRTAPIPSVAHESVERFQEWAVEGDADPGNRHSDLGPASRHGHKKNTVPSGRCPQKVLMRHECYF